jgi:hypothetical protein
VHAVLHVLKYKAEKVKSFFSQRHR